MVENSHTTKLRPKYVRFLALLLSTMLLVLIWSGFLITTRSINANFNGATTAALAAETTYIDDQLDRAFQQVDATLTTLASLLHILAKDEKPITNDSLIPLLGDDRLIRSLSLLDSDGRVLASSSPANVGVTAPVEQLLKDARFTNTTSQGVIYGQARSYRTITDWANDLPSLTQRLIPAAMVISLGGQDHTLLAIINVAYFNNFWERIGHSANTEIAVFNYDGLIILTHHGQGVEAQVLFRAIGKRLDTQQIGQFFLTDDEQFLVAYRASKRYPKITASVANVKQMREAVQSEVQWLLTMGIFGSLLIVVVIFLTYRLYIRYERAATYSKNLLEGITAHVMMSRSSADGIIQDVNAPFLEATGYRRDEVIGHKSHLLDEGFENQAFLDDLKQTLSAGNIWKGTFRDKTKNGSLIWLNSTVIPLKNEWGKPEQFVAMYSDISKAIKMSEEIERERVARHALEILNQKLQTEATRDALTGSWNRRGLDQFLEEISNDQHLSQGSVSVLMLDIDNFKLVNDSRGHIAGDEVLRKTVAVWLTNLRSSDLLIRLGGEEFAILLFHNTTDETRQVAEKLRLATKGLRVEAPDDGPPLSVTVSIGIALASQASRQIIEALMQKADVALYEAKQAGRNCIKVAA